MEFVTLREEAEAVAGRIQELDPTISFVIMNDTVVYSIEKKKFIFKDDLGLEFTKGNYQAFDWAKCKENEGIV
jgi:hypothetical protein